MDEYSVRYGDVLKENSFKVDNNIRTKPSTPQLFYGEPRKKVKESVTQVKEKCKEMMYFREHTIDRSIWNPVGSLQF